MTTPSDERSIGRLEGRLNAVERDLTELKREIADDMKSLSGKLDAAITQISALSAQLMGVLATRSNGWKVATMLAGASGWVMFIYGMMHH